MKDFFTPDPVILAHRGDSVRYPENTMPAFQSAVEMGVDVIETDVHLSQDGEVVIWHDDSLERMTGDPRKITEMNWDEIKKINAAYQFTPDGGKSFPYRENPVFPVLLRDLLSRFPEMRFNVDLKDDKPELAEAHGKILMETGALSRVVTASFHPAILKLFRRGYPGALTSCTSGEVLKLLILFHTRLLYLPLPYRMKVLQVPEFSGKTRILSSEFISVLHKRGFRIQVWTVNEKDEMVRFLQMGVDGIFTDRPALLKETLGKDL
ncbi:MAG: glycerophosphodiester phosphodiesterase [Spirochaetales bacterium]|nr:glycerophosphodiester phosphodiesterase [Spirochaetales bacterium]